MLKLALTWHHDARAQGLNFYRQLRHFEPPDGVGIRTCANGWAVRQFPDPNARVLGVLDGDGVAGPQLDRLAASRAARAAMAKSCAIRVVVLDGPDSRHDRVGLGPAEEARLLTHRGHNGCCQCAIAEKTRPMANLTHTLR